MKELFHHAYDVKEKNGRYRPTRFTDRQIDSLSRIVPMFGKYARCAAGVSLKFYTRAEEISFAYRYTVLYTSSGGFDVYENGVMYCNAELPEKSCEGEFVYRKENTGETLIEIFFPANAEIEVWDLNLGECRAASADGGKFVLYYGDSLTQSAYTKTPSLSFPSLAAALTGTQYLNRGIGSLFYDETCLDENDDVKPDIIFVEFGANDLVKHDAENRVVITDDVVQYCGMDDIPLLIQRAEVYLKKLKAIYPLAQIHVLSPLYSCEKISEALVSVRSAYRAGLRALAEKLDLTFIDGTTVSAHIAECHVQDGIHLTALGGALAAQSLIKYIAR